MSDEIQYLSNEELIQEYRETVEFRTEESLQGQVSNRQIRLRKALEKEILDRIESESVESSKINDVYEYIEESPDCTYIEVLQSVESSGDTIEALAELRQAGEIYEPEKGSLRVTEE